MIDAKYFSNIKKNKSPLSIVISQALKDTEKWSVWVIPKDKACIERCV